MKRFILLAVVALLLGAGVWGYLYAQSRNSSLKYRVAQVERGPLTAAVSATGNLNAVVTVQVGSQVSGMIKELLVDFNSLVKKGQVIARIDPQIFEAQVNQAKADLQTSKAAVLNQVATVEKAKADVENARAALAQGKAMTAKADAAQADAKRIFDRNAELFKRNLIAQADRDTAEANYDQAVAQSESSRANERALTAGIDSSQAQLRVQEAALQSARAQVDQKTAALAQAQANLDYTTILAPVDGVVVSRAVDVGQTVAASLQAPTLFTIAQDLTKMQVETSVDEADIGRIKVEDRATFTVDAFSGQTFAGVVTQIRKAAQIVQNVVTYTVIISVDNPGGRLLPGMTANVKLVYAEKPSVLKVPNAALRFRPAGADAGPTTQPRPGASSAQPRADGSGRAVDDMREGLVTSLGLTVEQQRKLDPILTDAQQQIAALRDLTDWERRARAEKIRQAARVQIREILTPEQRTKYDERIGRGSRGGAAGGGTPGRAWIVDAAGQPKAVPLMLGLSDGSATEVLQGDLKEGQDVITGTVSAAQQNRPGTTGTTGGAPRLRL